ncbi:hypothetical protein ARMGADRAFT_1011760 [Armillaria gallica]|uniref:Uncharacterized protein n=1 Tax=Armillaria gallica TaxID=47427 RepID=A0A2H3E0N3_ARMGA|nr:hypothetical protein ARMGADRAFT_1011760 [Armillaria gallica]
MDRTETSCIPQIFFMPVLYSVGLSFKCYVWHLGDLRTVSAQKLEHSLVVFG